MVGMVDLRTARSSRIVRQSKALTCEDESVSLHTTSAIAEPAPRPLSVPMTTFQRGDERGPQSQPRTQAPTHSLTAKKTIRK